MSNLVYKYPERYEKDDIKGVFQSYQYKYKNFAKWLLEDGVRHRKTRGLESGDFTPEKLLDTVINDLEKSSSIPQVNRGSSSESFSNYEDYIERQIQILEDTQHRVLIAFSSLGIKTYSDLTEYWSKVKVDSNINSNLNKILNEMIDYTKGHKMEAIFKKDLGTLRNQYYSYDQDVIVEFNSSPNSKTKTIKKKDESIITVGLNNSKFRSYLQEILKAPSGGGIQNVRLKSNAGKTIKQQVKYTIEWDSDGNIINVSSYNISNSDVFQDLFNTDAILRVNLDTREFKERKTLQGQISLVLNKLKKNAMNVLNIKSLTSDEIGLLKDILKETTQRYSVLYITKAKEKQNKKDKVVLLISDDAKKQSLIDSSDSGFKTQQGEIGELGDVLTSVCLNYGLQQTQKDKQNENKYSLKIYKTGSGYNEANQQLGTDIIIQIFEGEEVNPYVTFGIQTKNPFERSLSGNMSDVNNFYADGKNIKIPQQYYTTYEYYYHFGKGGDTKKKSADSNKFSLYDEESYRQNIQNFFRSYLSFNYASYENFCQVIINEQAVSGAKKQLLDGLYYHALSFMRMNKQVLTDKKINKELVPEIKGLSVSNLYYTVGRNLVSSIDILCYLKAAIIATKSVDEKDLGVEKITLNTPDYKGNGKQEPIVEEKEVNNLLAKASIRTQMRIPIVK